MYILPVKDRHLIKFLKVVSQQEETQGRGTRLVERRITRELLKIVKLTR